MKAYIVGVVLWTLAIGLGIHQLVNAPIHEKVVMTHD
jgi:hypothetical protein